jgi:hypothetical protein
VDGGKITGTRRAHWVTLIESGAHMAEVLAGIPDETAVPVSEVGQSADVSGGNMAEAGQRGYTSKVVAAHPSFKAVAGR